VHSDRLEFLGQMIVICKDHPTVWLDFQE
jgi:uncharacterized Zn-finger protein